MAGSAYRLLRNGCLGSPTSKNIHLSTELRSNVNDPLDHLKKKGPTDTEKRIMMALKFAAVFFPGVYIGAVMQKKGFFNFKKSKKSEDKEESTVGKAVDSIAEAVEKGVTDMKKK